MKAALFDLDDTLFDHINTSRAALADLREAYLPPGLERSGEEFETRYLQLVDEYHPVVLQGQLTLEEARRIRVGRLFREFGRPLDDGEAREAADAFRTAYQRERRAVPGAAALLRRLREQEPGLLLGVITNNFTAEQESKLRYCELDGLVAFMVTSEAVGVAKPEPAIFHAALEQAGCSPEEAVLVGDSWASDVLGAAGVGMRSVWFNRQGSPRPDPALDSCTEVRTLEPPEPVIAAVLGRVESRS